MIFCTGCSSANPTEAKFCHRCGKLLPVPGTPSANVGAESPKLSNGEIRHEPGKPPSTLVATNLVLFCVLECSLIFVLPHVGGMFADFGARLPAPTEFILALAAFYKRWLWGCHVLLAGAVVIFFVSNSPNRGERNWLKLAARLQFSFLIFILAGTLLSIAQLVELLRNR